MKMERMREWRDLCMLLASIMIEYRLTEWMDQQSYGKNHRLFDKLSMEG